MSSHDGLWEILSLRGQKVPPNTVCNIIMQNTGSKASYAGARQVGSSLERKINLSPGTSLPMNVNTNNDSEIEIFIEKGGNIKYSVGGHFLFK